MLKGRSRDGNRGLSSLRCRAGLARQHTVPPGRAGSNFAKRVSRDRRSASGPATGSVCCACVRACGRGGARNGPAAQAGQDLTHRRTPARGSAAGSPAPSGASGTRPGSRLPGIAATGAGGIGLLALVLLVGGRTLEVDTPSGWTLAAGLRANTFQTHLCSKAPAVFCWGFFIG